MACLGNKLRSFCHFWGCTQVLCFGLFCWLWGLLHFFYGILAHYIKRQKIWHWKMSPQVGGCPICYWGRVEEITTNNSRKNEVAWPKWKWCSVVDLSGDESKMWCCKEQYCIGTWNIRSMNQGKLDLVKQEMARVNINILGISELNGWI